MGCCHSASQFPKHLFIARVRDYLSYNYREESIRIRTLRIRPLGLCALCLVLSCTAKSTGSSVGSVPDLGDTAEPTDTGDRGPAKPLDWGEEGPWVPEYYPASDVPESQVDLIRHGHTTASEAWGNYGPLEYWIIGNDLEAAVEHDVYFCTVRREKDPGLPPEFDEMCLGRGYSFDDYARDGGAGLNTRRSEYEDYSVFLVTFGSKYPSPDETDYTTVAYHEYFHVVQNAHIYTRDEDQRRRLMVENPWWSEGGAEYMAQLLYSRQAGVPDRYLSDRMTWKMETKSMLEAGERFTDIPYGERARVAYDLGAWFIAYLIDLVGEEAYRIGFYSDLNDLGWEGAFQANFGVSSEDMLNDFEVFLELPHTEQMAIIP
jgi:hypothetical protein